MANMEFELIDFIKANPILYDRQYRNHYMMEKNQKWEEIAKKLRRNPNTLKMKWKSLRDNYKKRLRRTHCEEEDALTSRNWKYHNSLSFLKDQYLDESLCKMEDDTDQDAAQLQLDNEEYLSDEAEYEVENFDLNEYLKKEDSLPSVTTKMTQSTTVGDDAAKKRKMDKDALISEACKEMTALLQSAKQHFTPPSATQSFFNSMALQVIDARLPTSELMRLQQRVLEVVTQEIVMYQERTFDHA